MTDRPGKSMDGVHVGTSGWHYAHWRGLFYPRELPTAEWLHYYAGELPAVEINNTFYQLPDTATLATWRDAVPADFTFSVKAPRQITHLHKLRDCTEAAQRFLERIALLEEKLGPVLFQLPPHWHRNPVRLDAFLAGLPAGFRYGFEFRDPDWHHEDVYAVLQNHGAAFCIYHLEGFLSPETVTAPFIYVRLHGPTGAYAGRYSAAHLRSWAIRIRRWVGQDRQVYLFFDNDQNAYAAKNARLLNRYLAEPSPGRRSP